MKAIAKKSLRIAGAIFFVLAFTLTNKDGNIDGLNFAAFVAGTFCLLYSETSTEKSNNNA